ncbi:MAG: hypothetical protein Kow0062_04720 [Acidobacteriota bacterium]
MGRTLDDLLGVAIDHEIASQRLYRRALERTTDGPARAFLESLIEEEQGHERTLRELREMAIWDGSVPVEDEDLFAAPSASHGEDGVPADAGLDTLLAFALRREHRARMLFEQAARAARHPELVSLFEGLAREEAQHHRDIEGRFLRQQGRLGDEM